MATKISHTEERKSAISKALTGRKLSEEAAAKARVASLGLKQSDEHKAKRAASLTGVAKTEEAKQKMREAKAFNVEVEGVVYSNLQDAANAHNVSKMTVSNRVKSSSYPTWKKV
jgi:hypothetical protein